MTDDRRRTITEGFKLISGIGGVRCAICDDFIWSQYRHDFHHCKCGYTFVDGGRDYLRYGAGRDGEDGPPQQPKIEKYDILIDIKTGRQTLLPPE